MFTTTELTGQFHKSAEYARIVSREQFYVERNQFSQTVHFDSEISEHIIENNQLSTFDVYYGFLEIHLNAGISNLLLRQNR
jgi:hypothetical protein